MSSHGSSKDKKSSGGSGAGPCSSSPAPGGLEEPGPEHRGAHGAQAGVLALLLSFLRTQGVRSQLPLSDDMIWVVAVMKLSSG